MKVRLTMTGETPLYLNNPVLSNPIDPMKLEIEKITSKRKKTPADYKLIARLSFEASLYHESDVGVFVPAWNVKACIIHAARLQKLGTKVERGLTPLDRIVPLIYDGPKSIDDLWEAGFWRTDTMGQGRIRVARTRPYFEEWSIVAEAELDESQLGLPDLEHTFAQAGAYMGFGDSRKMGFGRFASNVEVM